MLEYTGVLRHAWGLQWQVQEVFLNERGDAEHLPRTAKLVPAVQGVEDAEQGQTGHIQEVQAVLAMPQEVHDELDLLSDMQH